MLLAEPARQGCKVTTLPLLLNAIMCVVHATYSVWLKEEGEEKEEEEEEKEEEEMSKMRKDRWPLNWRHRGHYPA